MRSMSSIWRCRRGISALEFALVLPVLLTLFLGVLETAMFLLASQKVEKLAATAADVIAQSETVTNIALDRLIGAASQIMEPLPFNSGNAAIVVSSIYHPADVLGVEQPTIVNWQRYGAGGGSGMSHFGTQGQVAILPAGFALAERENVIAAEILYTYRPILPGLFLEPRQVYRRAFFKPRLGALTQAPI